MVFPECSKFVKRRKFSQLLTVNIFYLSINEYRSIYLSRICEVKENLYISFSLLIQYQFGISGRLRNRPFHSSHVDRKHRRLSHVLLLLLLILLLLPTLFLNIHHVIAKGKAMSNRQGKEKVELVPRKCTKLFFLF